MRWFLPFVFVFLNSCIIHRVEVTPVELRDQPEITVESPVKAHMKDGSTVVFEDGIRVRDGRVWGNGEKYDLSLNSGVETSSVSLDDLAAMESFQSTVDRTATTLGTGGAVVGGILGGGLLAVAIFGSCPTTYADIGGESILEAESFSYSIVPNLEARDVDKLGTTARNDEVILEVRNEALESHYINQIELLQVSHQKHQSVFPDPDGGLVVFDSPLHPISAVDQSGHDLMGVLEYADGTPWRAETERLARVSMQDLEDHIHLEFDIPPSQDDVALLLRFRNSLLNTVLLYDVMLKGLGFQALDWMSARTPDLQMLKTAHWYNDRMGMRIEVWDQGRYREIAHVEDQGPIAWKELAVPLAVPSGARVKLRLSFLTDNWRIDWVAAAPMQPVVPNVIPVRQVSTTGQIDLEKTLSSLASPDTSYVMTKPGDRMKLSFDVKPEQEDNISTFFLAAQGYYIEWMRSDWLQPSDKVSVAPSDESLLRAIELWRDRRESFRHQFESSRIAVR